MEGIEPGRYHYDPLGTSIVQLRVVTSAFQLLVTTLGTDWLMHAQAVITIIGNFNRVSWKYGSRDIDTWDSMREMSVGRCI